MADEDITLDGQPLHSLRVADLKAALEQRNLPKSGQKNTLIKRLKGALMLENLQKSSTSHSGLQPNSQIGEEMSQNSFIKQYLAKQQELLRQRLEREALQQDAERPVVLDDDDDQSEDNDGSSYGKHQPMPSQLPLSRTEERASGELMMGHGLMTRRPDMGVGPPLHPQEVPEAPGARMLRAAFHHGHKEPPAPSPPRAVASLSVRVLGQPDHQGLPPTVPRAQEKEGTAPAEPGSAHPVLHLSRSAGIAAGDCIHVDSDEDDDDDDDDEWGPGPGGARKGNRAPPQPPQVPVVVPSARSKRKLQPPQHIPPPQAHHSPMQLRHPTPPPSPPPNLFPLPDTPKQSPPDTDDKEGESSGPRGPSVPPPAMQRQDSASSSRSSSPEPPVKRGPGPLSLLVHKMESEGAGTAKPGASTGESPLLKLERKRLQENQEKEEEREKKQPEKEERRKATQTADKNQMDSGSSSDSDSRSDSSSPSSQSSSPAKHLQKVDQGHEAHSEKKNLRKGPERESLPKGEVSEPSAAAVTEAELDSESSMAQQPASGAEPVNSESHLEESTTPKAFSARKISLTGSKTSPTATEAAAAEAETGAAAGRKRRWGSSTAVTAKKPSISITTDSLKSLIPDIKVAQEAVVELHPEELQLSGDEESLDSTRGDQDKGLKIRRTVTQVVPADGQENGQGNEEEEEEEEKTEREKQHRTSTEKRKSLSEDAAETQTSAALDAGEAKKVTPSDSLVRRSISQQKSGVSITIDDPIRTSKPPSPPRGKLSNIIHVTNLVRPFTLGQLKELLNQTGSLVEDGFWIDKIKSHCYVTYATTEEAAATRAALHGVKWPQSNPKVLSVDFCEQDELDFHKGIIKPEREEDHAPPPMVPQTRLPPLMPERDRDRERDRERERERGAAVAAAAGVRDLWAEREREMQRRERARGEREWDRDKVREFARPGDDERRSRSRDRERRRRERPKSKERKTDRKEKGEELPAKLLDDLFLKTKAAPCIYWLPLTEEQATQRLLERTERQKERQRRLKEQKDEEDKKRDEEKKERPKGREKDGGGVPPAAAAAPGIRGAGRGADADRDRERARDRDGDKRRDGGHRPGRPLMGGGGGGGGGGRRSRSRSDTRDRRR